MNKQTFNDFKNEYENLESQDYSQLFDLVRRIVRDLMGKSRPGILLGLEDLGIGSRGYVGGYHRVGTNEIYLNRNVLQIMREDTPKEHFKEEHTPKNVEFVQLNHYDSLLTYI
ncbi:MAG: hypothetical protein ACXACP_05305 [Candidatus Hodarchaeales archaeon]